MSRLIRIDAQGLYLRSLRAEDASPEMCQALNSAQVRRWLNMPPILFTEQSLARFISLFDGVQRYILGIFTSDHLCIGLYTLDVQMPHETAIITTALWGEKGLGSSVLLRSMNELLDYFYTHTAVRKISCRIDRENWKIFSNLLSQLHDPATYRKRFYYEGTLWAEFKRADGSRMDAMVFASYHPSLTPPPVLKAQA